MMFNEPRARATRHQPVIANSHEAGAERVMLQAPVDDQKEVTNVD